MKDRDAYAEGVDARLAGESETVNPYADDSTDFMSWNDGYASIDEDEE